LGVETPYDYTPGVYRRIVFAATKNVSFEDASQSLQELGEINLLPKRIWRAVKRIGEERIAEQQTEASAYQKLPLPARQEKPAKPIPDVACVMMDGGRFQQRERVISETAPAADPPEDKSHWREFKGGCLLSMTSKVSAEDPCPQLPQTFVDPGKMREIAREIKGFTSESTVSIKADEEAGPDWKERPGRPEILVKSVVATRDNVEAFGPLLVAAAYLRGFHAATRKAFVADGSSTNWSVWREHFSHYTPILDFVHALMYVYAAAMVGREPLEGWQLYRDWSQWLWSGSVDRLITALEQIQQGWGLPEKNETGTPRAQVASTLGYLINQRERMKYDEYRRQGLPITSSQVESTIKQINRCIKGTEKFWDDGADPMLRLVADQLSETNVIAEFWQRRTQALIDSACYHQAC
jgi:hypothetical protein